MDDLKIVLYIVGVIAWVVYNNYKKIKSASSKRDFSKPPSEVIPENWPRLPQKPIRTESPVTREVTEKYNPREVRKVLERPVLVQRKPIRKPAITIQKRPVAANIAITEGGSTRPSKVVQFEEQDNMSEEPNALLTAIRNMDIRQGIVMAEVLKRPNY